MSSARSSASRPYGPRPPSAISTATYFELYVPGKLDAMLHGRMPPLGAVTEGVLLATAVMLAIPSGMVALSLIASPRASR